MEMKNRRQKKLISIFLLVVGVVFILAAGGIFVTTAWQYLPVFAKQLALLLVAGGLFGISVALGKNENLTWIANTLFYLGNAFVGFFVIAVMGGLFLQDVKDMAIQIFMASSAMLIPTVVRLLCKKEGIDYVVATLLVDVMIFSGCIALLADLTVYIICVTAFVVGLTLWDCKMQKENSGKPGFVLCSTVVTLLHLIGYAGFGWILLGTEDLGGMITFVIVAALLFTTGAEYRVRNHTAYRVWNSVTAIASAFLLVRTVVASWDIRNAFSMICFLAITISTVLMVLVRRREWTGIMIAFAVWIPYGQLFCYLLDALWILEDSTTWKTTYYAYSFVIAVGLIALYVVENGVELWRDWLQSKTLSFAGLQLGKAVFMWLASKMSSSFGMVFFLLVMADILAIAVVIKHNIVKRIVVSGAILALVTAVGIQPFIDIPEQFGVEWFCLMVTIGILLFRGLWLEKKEGMSLFCFVVTCGLLGVLLMNNLVKESFGNLLFLGMVGIVMLLLAAIKNNKKYVVASSATLILLVFYLTRAFWLSIAWWVYLFVAGVGLVLLAVKKAQEFDEVSH